MLDKIINEFNRRNALSKKDDEYMVNDDTQVGIEFAFEQLQKQDEWFGVNERLPTRFDSTHESNHHIDCYIFINGEVKERPWNIHHECWDDREYDDFEYSAKDPSHWMIKPEMPRAPVVSK